MERTTLDITEFELLLAAKSSTGKPALKDIRFYGHEADRSWLIAQQLLRQGSGSTAADVYVPVKIAARKPFVPRRNPSAKVDPNYTVIDYLKSLSATHPELRFSTRWWDSEPTRSAIFGIAGMVLLAGVCPMLMNVLATGSFRRLDENRPEYDLSQSANRKGTSKAAVPHGPGAEDLAHVRELDAELERRLARGVDSMPSASSQQSVDASPKIRELNVQPLEAPVAQTKPKQPKEYEGEFYPTETHVKHHEKLEESGGKS